MKKSESVVPQLTEDLVIEILLRLPVRALKQFKCVRKSWYSLINSSSFMAAKDSHLCHHHRPFIILTDSRDHPVTRIFSFDSLGNRRSYHGGHPRFP